MIEVEDLTVSFETVTALDEVSLELDSNEFVTVIGPSGCGKTTLLRTIGGLQDPTAGRVTLGGDPPARARADANIGFVFQEHALLPWKSALANVTFLRRLAGKPSDAESARALLETVGLDGFEDARPHELSGGMKQRVAIARALHLDADVLLMDEPFGELDEITRNELSVEMRRIWRETEKTVVFVTHSVPEAVLLGNRCLLMDGPPGTLTASFDIDLPSPREESVLGTNQFQREVARVREVLHG
ncbi:MAG: NitT/TauT family transport system ATP-binding protein [Haloarculaceae archaeon]|jgi:NitT/TauT family transport system ATP-binding protein